MAISYINQTYKQFLQRATGSSYDSIADLKAIQYNIDSVSSEVLWLQRFLRDHGVNTTNSYLSDLYKMVATSVLGVSFHALSDNKLALWASPKAMLYQRIKTLPGLVLYYPMNESSGTSVINRAPETYNTNNGTSSNVAVNQVGSLGTAYQFNGTSSYMTSSITMPTTAFSVGFLYKRTGTADASDRIVDWGDAGPSNGFDFTNPASGVNKINFIGRSSTSVIWSLFTDNLTLNQWYFVVGTYEINDINLYQDGVNKGSDTSGSMVASSQTVTIGKRATGSSNFSNFAMQHMFVTNTAVNEATVQQLSVIAGL